jgi:hypothetical protein
MSNFISEYIEKKQLELVMNGALDKKCFSSILMKLPWSKKVRFRYVYIWFSSRLLSIFARQDMWAIYPEHKRIGNEVYYIHIVMVDGFFKNGSIMGGTEYFEHSGKIMFQDVTDVLCEILDAIGVPYEISVKKEDYKSFYFIKTKNKISLGDVHDLMMNVPDLKYKLEML